MLGEALTRPDADFVRATTGFAIGGIELVHRVLTEQGRPEPVLSRLVAAGRLGQKTGKGYYRYEPGKRRAIPDPEVAAMVADASAAAGITRSTVKTWQDMGFLPVPLKVSLGMGGGVFNRYPAWAVPRARFVAEKRSAGFTYDEIRVMLAKADAEASRKPKTAPKPEAEEAKAPKAKASKAGRGGGR